MSYLSLEINKEGSNVSLNFFGEFTIYQVNSYQSQIDKINLNAINELSINFLELNYLDSAASIFIHNLSMQLKKQKIKVDLICANKDILDILSLVENYKKKTTYIPTIKTFNIIEKIGKNTLDNFFGFLSFMAFLGKLFINKIKYLSNIKNIRYKEIFFEINESGIKAFWIISLTSFLIGVVVAYQSSFQLKIYGANIFIVDMLGISILRELAPLITAIVIAGRSGSAFTAQIGSMKITQELDAMKTMGFDPYIFLVLPRIIALMIVMPILIFIADIMGIMGGMLVANLDLGITSELFLDRFNETIAVKHFFIGIIKGPFFAFLIASIGIYRGLKVKDDTQSIGLNTTKSVVESIFAVIVCDAIFSIAFINLGI
ncbi:MAG: ABC transporter permease [Sulfurimonas sp.]|nr:MAG: ABC transporter permease [Sulfurimonas sp.]